MQIPKLLIADNQCSNRELADKIKYINSLDYPHKHPPYAKRSRDNVTEFGWNIVFGVAAWDFTKKIFLDGDHKYTLLPPSDAFPYQYVWPVAGESVVMWSAGDYDDAVLWALIHALLRAGAVGVKYFDRDDFLRTVYSA